MKAQAGGGGEISSHPKEDVQMKSEEPVEQAKPIERTDTQSSKGGT